MNNRLYLLTIELIDIEPKIWRRFVAPGSISLDRLHDVIQIVMGWKDYHLHEFVIGNRRYTEDPESRDNGEADSLFRLVDLVKQKGRTIRYLYDFGDCWQHQLTIDNSRYVDPYFRPRLTASTAPGPARRKMSADHGAILISARQCGIRPIKNTPC